MPTNNNKKQGQTKKAKVTGIKFSTSKKAQQTAAKTPALASMAAINDKFKRLEELRAEINSLKALYAEHDALVQELLPLFIQKEDDHFFVAREIKIGNKKHRFNPAFYDSEKDLLIAKSWKSAAHESGHIE